MNSLVQITLGSQKDQGSGNSAVTGHGKVREKFSPGQGGSQGSLFLFREMEVQPR